MPDAEKISPLITAPNRLTLRVELDFVHPLDIRSPSISSHLSIGISSCPHTVFIAEKRSISNGIGIVFWLMNKRIGKFERHVRKRIGGLVGTYNNKRRMLKSESFFLGPFTRKNSL